MTTVEMRWALRTDGHAGAGRGVPLLGDGQVLGLACGCLGAPDGQTGVGRRDATALRRREEGAGQRLVMLLLKEKDRGERRPAACYMLLLKQKDMGGSSGEKE